MTPETKNILQYLAKNPMQYDSILRAFLDEHREHYSRSNRFGHITASAFILSADRQDVLLIAHKKYNKWLIPGGHVDARESALEAAKREAQEEVGLGSLNLINEGIFDIDIHRIPSSKTKDEPEHWHFDLRFLFHASEEEQVKLNVNEATDYQWLPLSVAKQFRDKSLVRMVNKLP